LNLTPKPHTQTFGQQLQLRLPRGQPTLPDLPEIPLLSIVHARSRNPCSYCGDCHGSLAHGPPLLTTCDCCCCATCSCRVITGSPVTKSHVSMRTRPPRPTTAFCLLVKSHSGLAGSLNMGCSTAPPGSMRAGYCTYPCVGCKTYSPANEMTEWNSMSWSGCGMGLDMRAMSP
jgi:hypothetical protein